jgi:hypothetical protein
MVNLHEGAKWSSFRSCHCQDLILVSEGVQCANCGALVTDNRTKEQKEGAK